MHGVRLPGGSFGIYRIPQSEEGKVREKERGIQKGKKDIDFEESTKNGRQGCCRHSVSCNNHDNPGRFHNDYGSSENECGTVKKCNQKDICAGLKYISGSAG